MRDPYEVLGLQAGAGRLELNRAYQRLKELYAQDSLAIYSLLTDSERKDRLEQIESAFQSIIDFLRVQSGDTVAGSPGVGQPATIPDPVLSTGAYLRWAREQAGLSIGQLADRTKIGSSMLEDIETERVDRLPPRVYLRGFVYEFARCLGLADALQLPEFYLKRVLTGEE
jgi:cytoskeleton protein RodZ